MLIIDLTYFEQGEINIPNSTSEGIDEKVQSFIDKYEAQYLEKALGYPLFKLLKAALPTPANPSRFYDLLNGAEYQDQQARTKYWPGLKNKLRCPISMYVWFWFQSDTATYGTSMGEMKGRTENATASQVIDKQCRAYNEMVNITYAMWDFLTWSKAGANKAFPEFKLQDVDVCEFRITNTLNL